MTPPRRLALPLAAAMLAAAVAVPLGGCVPMVVAAGVGAGAMVAGDRRSAGVQLDDQSREFRITTEAGTRWGNDIHLNVTSYNGVVLLTGEAPSAQVSGEIGRLASAQGGVKRVENALVVGPVSDLGARSNDTLITSKVKARFVEAGKFDINTVKVVTERSVVYLLGIVKRSEAADAAELAATTAGAARVVKVFDYLD
jgi:osmotically-inducible protein OsmY